MFLTCFRGNFSQGAPTAMFLCPWSDISRHFETDFLIRTMSLWLLPLGLLFVAPPSLTRFTKSILGLTFLWLFCGVGWFVAVLHQIRESRFLWLMDNLGLDLALKNITEDCLKNLLPKPRALTSMFVSLMAWQIFLLPYTLHPRIKLTSV